MNMLCRFTRPISPASDQYIQYLLTGANPSVLNRQVGATTLEVPDEEFGQAHCIVFSKVSQENLFCIFLRFICFSMFFKILTIFWNI
jgi:hypothetical protein